MLKCGGSVGSITQLKTFYTRKTKATKFKVGAVLGTQVKKLKLSCKAPDNEDDLHIAYPSYSKT